jgi:methionyl-tRNA synthetase
LLAKIEDEEIQKQIDKLEATKTPTRQKTNSEPKKEAIQFDDFAKMDMRRNHYRSFENAKSKQTVDFKK